MIGGYVLCFSFEIIPVPLHMLYYWGTDDRIKKSRFPIPVFMLPLCSGCLPAKRMGAIVWMGWKRLYRFI